MVRAGGIVKRVGPGIRRLEVQPVPERMAVVDLQGVVNRVGRVLFLGDVVVSPEVLEERGRGPSS